MAADLILSGNGNGEIDIARTARMVDVTITEAAAAHVGSWNLDQRTVAIHEAGHSIAATLLGIRMAAVTIKGASGGHLEPAEDDDDLPRFRRDSVLRSLIVVYLAGPEAVRHLLGEGTTGAEHDLLAATAVAIQRVENGLDPAMPPISLAAWNYSVPDFLLNRQAELVILAMQRAEEEAQALVAEHADKILAFAAILYDRRRFDGEAIYDALRSIGVEPKGRP